jgi:ketosteroid isomerase-like protein
LADDVRLYRDGSFPFVGKSAASKRLAESPGILICSQIDAKLSGSADLGYTYGSAEFRPKDSSKATEYANYLRIWKRQRDGSWKIVLDMLSPAPKL